MHRLSFLALLGCVDKPDSHPTPGPVDSGVVDTGEPEATPECAPWTASVQQEWDATDLVGAAQLPEFGGNAGVGLGDLDADGWLDAVVVTPVGSMPLHNDGTGTLRMETDWVGGTWPAATGIAMADVDGDGDLDAWLGRMTGLSDLLLINDGTGKMTQTEISSSTTESYSGSFMDIDADGDLDLFVAGYTDAPDIDAVVDGTLVGSGNAIYLNEDGEFVLQPEALPAEVVDDITFHGQWLDANQDGHFDLYLASDFGPFLGRNRLVLGDGLGGFSLADDCACDLAMFGMGVAVGDANGDGLQDLYVTDLDGPNLLLGEGDARFFDGSLSYAAHIADDGRHLASWGTAFVDLDGNGWQDLPIVFGRVNPNEAPESFQELGEAYEGWLDNPGQQDVLLMHSGLAYEDVSSASGFEHDGDGRALAVGDFDNDGRPDLLTAGMWFARHVRGEGGCEERITLSLHDEGLQQGLGARILAVVDGREQTMWMLPSTTWSSSEHAQWLGLAGAERADRIEVHWPGGAVSSWSDVPAGSHLQLTPDL